MVASHSPLGLLLFLEATVLLHLPPWITPITYSILSAARAVDAKALCVVPGRFCWRVFVDCLVLEAGGSLLDALVLAACVALRDATFPKLRLVPGELPGDMDVELDDDEDAAASRRFPADALPVCLTFTQLAGASIVDASAAEEAVADNSVSVAVNGCVRACVRGSSVRVCELSSSSSSFFLLWTPSPLRI